MDEAKKGGQKRVQSVGKVSILPEAFIEVLKA
jgi:translation elongation factor EF-4